VIERTLYISGFAQIVQQPETRSDQPLQNTKTLATG
jgi:hypothetical protein